MSNESLMNAIVETAQQANQLDANAQRMVVATYRLLAEGRPVSLERFADALALSREAAEQVVALVPPGALDRDERGDVTAFAGLALEPTEHRMEMGGATLFCWCAFDTLFIPALLGKTAQVASRDPLSGKTIRFSLGPNGYEGSPDVCMSLVKTEPEAMRENVRAAFCHNVYFFDNAEVASRYLEENPGFAALPISDAVTLAERWNSRIYGDALS